MLERGKILNADVLIWQKIHRTVRWPSLRCILCYDFYSNIPGSVKVKLKGQHLWLDVDYHKIYVYFPPFL